MTAKRAAILEATLEVIAEQGLRVTAMSINAETADAGSRVGTAQPVGYAFVELSAY